MPTSLVSTGVQFPDNSIQTTAATAGGLNLVTTVTGTAASSILVNSGFTTTYDYYDLIFAGTASASDSLYMRYVLNGSIITTNTYQSKVIINGTYYDFNNEAYVVLCNVNNAAGNNFSGTIRLTNPTLTTTRKLINYTAVAYRGATLEELSGTCMNFNTTNLTGLQFYVPSGAAILTMTARLYGYAK